MSAQHYCFALYYAWYGMREKANPRFKLFRNVHLVVEKMAVIGQPKLQIHSLPGNVK